MTAKEDFIEIIVLILLVVVVIVFFIVAFSPEHIQAQKDNYSKFGSFEQLLKSNDCYTVDVQSIVGRDTGKRSAYEQSMHLNGKQYPLLIRAFSSYPNIEYFKYPIKYYCAKGEVNYSTNLYFLDLDLYAPNVSKYRPSVEEVLKTKDKKFVYQPVFDACYKGTSLFFQKPCN